MLFHLVEDIAINDLLSEFIFRGGEWSPRLPAGYSYEAKWLGG